MSASSPSLDLTQKRCTHPPISVIVCTTGDRPEQMRRCVASILEQDCDNFELLVVLNAAADHGFETALRGFNARLLHEPRPAMCAARNRALREARGTMVAFTEDDVLVHPGWLHALAAPFARDGVGCVTGCVLPEGPGYLAQERYTGPLATSEWSFSRNDSDWFQRALKGDTGIGCNMAFRKEVLSEIGGCPEDLGVGTPMGGCDEPYQFLATLAAGYAVHHAPDAVVTHYFDPDPAVHKRRLTQLHSAHVAFLLHLASEARFRRQALRELGRGMLKLVGARPAGAQSTAVPLWRRLWAYASGPWLWLEARRWARSRRPARD